MSNSITLFVREKKSISWMSFAPQNIFIHYRFFCSFCWIFHTQVIYPTEKKYFASWIQLIINYQNVQFNFAEKIIRQNICWKWRSQFGGTEFVRKSFLSYLYSSMTCSAVNFKIANFKLTSTLPNRQYNYFIKVRKPIVIKQKVHIDDFPLINKWT